MFLNAPLWAERCCVCQSLSLLSPSAQLQPSASRLLRREALGRCLRQRNSSGVWDGAGACLWNQAKLRLTPWTGNSDGGAHAFTEDLNPPEWTLTGTKGNLDAKPDEFFQERRKATVSLLLILTFLITTYNIFVVGLPTVFVTFQTFSFTQSCGIIHPLLSNWQLECFSPPMYLMGIPVIHPPLLALYRCDILS